ncbi:hypothetical protein F6J84_12315 [Microbacterium caowuchunii]|uniref:hypothetical protein n=1 Tax=Microbacterium caowuchunii TaxID=2614638 RepID=UPI0012475B86|nr:hypothetical protein [Microbacterium caowuchunii]QEW00808.1 hypothetical protein F6J84_12315 [Microbacterium caowuchunii]
MTLRDVLRMLRRRWYVVVLILALTGAATVGLARDGGIHHSRTIVMFTMPGAGTVTPYNGSDSWSVITFAQTIATQASGGRAIGRYYSHADAPLYGAGLREAVVVAVRSDGSQWSSRIESAVIEVQIVGRTEQWVRERQDDLVTKIIGITASEQAAAGVPEGDRIDAHVEPLTTAIEYVSPSRTAGLAAILAMAIAGVLTAGAAAWALDRRRPPTRRVVHAPTEDIEAGSRTS